MIEKLQMSGADGVLLPILSPLLETLFFFAIALRELRIINLVFLLIIFSKLARASNVVDGRFIARPSLFPTTDGGVDKR